MAQAEWISQVSRVGFGGDAQFQGLVPGASGRPQVGGARRQIPVLPRWLEDIASLESFAAKGVDGQVVHPGMPPVGVTGIVLQRALYRFLRAPGVGLGGVVNSVEAPCDRGITATTSHNSS